MEYMPIVSESQCQGKQTLLKRITIMRFSLLIKLWNKQNSPNGPDDGTGNGAGD